MGPCVWSTHSLLQAAIFPDLCGEQGKEKSNNSTRCGIPPSVLEGVREPGKMSGLIFVPFFFFFNAVPVWFQWVCVWTMACFEKRDTENSCKREDPESQGNLSSTHYEE